MRATVAAMSNGMSKLEQARNRAAFSAGVWLLVGCLALGAFAGLALEAVHDESGFAEVTTWFAITDLDGVFNWGVFLAFALVGILCFAIGVVGQAITDAIRAAQPASNES